ncbi:MAG: ThuA domain-containing protein [Bacteroidales bacterium]|nr:ThuA domain-containing protein [Bacteroidales bacterium]
MLRLIYILIFVTVAGCSKSPEVLVIVGGHEYDTTEFFEMFHSMEGINFDSVSHPAALELLSSSKVGQYDLLIFYDFIPDMPLSDSTLYLKLTRLGMPMIFMHHAICTFQQWDGYQQMVGGRYVMPGFHPDSTLHSGYAHDMDLKIEVLDPSHPVTSGTGEFMIHDEGYYNILINKEVHPLLGTSHRYCAPQVAWVNECDRSTCLYLMFGHDKQAYTNTSLHQLLKNSIFWLSGL